MAWKNANAEIYQIGTTSSLVETYVSNYDLDTPISESLTPSNYLNYIVPGDVIPVVWSSWTTIQLTYGSITYGADGYGYIAVYDNDGNVLVEIRGILFWLTTNDLYLIAGIDKVNQSGRIGLYLKPQSGSASGVYFNAKSNNRKAYEFITQNALGATVRVTYAVPQEEHYDYAFITYKKDTRPINQNDGNIIDINTTLDSVDIDGLDEGSDYWFTIYTNKSESESFPYTIPIDPVPPEYKRYINNINGTGFDWIKELEQDTATITNSDRSTFTTNMYKHYPLNKVTWYTYSHIGTDVGNWNKTTFSSQTTALFVSDNGIDTVNITGSNDSYTCTIKKKNNSSDNDPNYMFVYDKTVTMGGIYTEETLPRAYYANFNNHSGYLSYGPNCNPWYSAGSWATRTFTGTLTQVFEELQKYVRNIDIKVNGVLWSKAGK